MMNKSLRPTQSIPPHTNTAHQFEAVLEFAAKQALLGEAQLQAIAAALRALLQNQLERYTMKETGSVPVDQAETLLRSILYTLGMALKDDPAQDPIRLLETTPLAQLHAKGHANIEKELASARRLWRAAKNMRISTPNHYYNETLDHGGILAFFTFYDPAFAAHSTPTSIDYPLNKISEESGVVFIHETLSRFILENRFVRLFPPAGVHHTLLQANRTYIDLPLNLFEPVLLCALGCVLTQTDPATLTPNPALLEQVAKPLHSEATAATLLANATTRLCLLLGLPKQDILCAALQETAAGVLPRAVAAAQNNRLSQLFYAQRIPRKAVALRYTDGALLNDIAFRNLLEEVHACRFLSDKIAILLHLPSLQDLVDALQDECLTRAEFPALLQKLDTETVNELQLALPEWFQRGQ